ncbi:MAG: MarR family transcriptional regulator [Pseudomonadota bacterium]
MNQEMRPDPQTRPEPLSKARLRLWLRLLKASRHIEDEVRRRLRADYASTLPRFDVMSALARAPEGLKMGEISERLRVSGGNVTGIVDRLAEEGLAARIAVPGDRRAHRVTLTDKGRAAFADHAAAHEAWIDDLLGGLDPEEVTALAQSLDRLDATLKEPAP